MIPQTTAKEVLFLSAQELPTKTYYIHRENGTIAGFCEGKMAMEQAVYKILATQRYEWIIYSFDYGIELQDLFGKSVGIVYPELERRIKEALLADSRITNVSDFQFSHKKGTVFTTFHVETTEGEFRIAKEWELHV